MFTFVNIMQLYSFTFPVDVFFGGHCVFDSAPAWAPALLLQFRVQTVVTLLHTKGLPVYSYNGVFLVAQIPPKTWHPASAMLLPQYGHYGSAAVDGNLRMNNDVTEGGRRRGGPLSKALALHEFSLGPNLSPAPSVGLFVLLAWQPLS